MIIIYLIKLIIMIISTLDYLTTKITNFKFIHNNNNLIKYNNK
jgi:hypothetical protein